MSLVSQSFPHFRETTLPESTSSQRPSGSPAQYADAPSAACATRSSLRRAPRSPSASVRHSRRPLCRTPAALQSRDRADQLHDIVPELTLAPRWRPKGQTVLVENELVHVAPAPLHVDASGASAARACLAVKAQTRAGGACVARHSAQARTRSRHSSVWAGADPTLPLPITPTSHRRLDVQSTERLLKPRRIPPGTTNIRHAATRTRQLDQFEPRLQRRPAPGHASVYIPAVGAAYATRARAHSRRADFCRAPARASTRAVSEHRELAHAPCALRSS